MQSSSKLFCTALHTLLMMTAESMLSMFQCQCLPDVLNFANRHQLQATATCKAVLMMTAESVLSKRPVLRFTVVLFLFLKLFFVPHLLYV